MNLHRALRAFIHSQVPRQAFSEYMEQKFVNALARRVRQLQRAGHTREQILPILLQELAGDVAPAPPARPVPADPSCPARQLNPPFAWGQRIFRSVARVVSRSIPIVQFRRDTAQSR